MVLSFSGVAFAVIWSDYDLIGKYLAEGDEYLYTGLDIAAEDTFVVGVDKVISAKVTFWVTDEWDIGEPLTGKDLWKEYAYTWVEGDDSWTSVGEVDSGDYFTMGVNSSGLDALNTFGNIWTAVKAGNAGGPSFGDFIWAAAEVTAESAPVPEPGTIVLMGLGLVGLAGMGRKKLFKK